MGVAGAFAGVANGSLLVAGGANFPLGPPWTGGQKVWRETVYALDRPDGQWKEAGTLPRPLAYGVSATHRETLVCVGGSDANAHYAAAFTLSWQGGKLLTSSLPPLPNSMANGCGALLGDTLYVAGGQERPESTQALRSVYRIDLSAAKPQWQAIRPCPGSGRILATAAACDSAFWVIGGAELIAGADGKVTRRYLCDAYRYDDAEGWKRIADLPHAVVAAPSPAPCNDTDFFVLGGDDGLQQGLPSPMLHKGFSNQILCFDWKSGEWHAAGPLAAARVTTPCVIWSQRAIIPSGEVRPGIRSPEIWSVEWPPRIPRR
jgi:N-acetylneuraminic acid mutarotase